MSDRPGKVRRWLAIGALGTAVLVAVVPQPANAQLYRLFGDRWRRGLTEAEADSVDAILSTWRVLSYHRDRVFPPGANCTPMVRTRRLPYPSALGPRPPVGCPSSYDTVQMSGNRMRDEVNRPLLIERLDSLATVFPTSPIVQRNRVGTRILHGDLGGALEAAVDCRAADWWCAALRGFALHEAGKYLEAEVAFDEALAGMPSGTRCSWIGDIALLLTEDVRQELGAPPCYQLETLERRIWWLADPFYLLPGNDRKTEHFARLVSWYLYDDTRDAWDLEWRPCSSVGIAPYRRAIVSQGVSDTKWSVAGPPRPNTELPGYRFLPAGVTLVDPGHSVGSEWALERRAAPLVGMADFGDPELDFLLCGDFVLEIVEWEDRYDPAYTVFPDLTDQTAFFWRGDSFEVASATELLRHPLALRPEVSVGLVLTRDEFDVPTVLMAEGDDFRYRFRATIPPDPHLLSIEAVALNEGAARARFGHDLIPPAEGQMGLSDLLLFEWEDDLPEELDDVAPRMFGSARVSDDTQMGVFWEMYGLIEGEPLQFELAVIPDERGILGRLGQAVRIIAPDPAVTLDWVEEGTGDDIVGMALELDVRALPEGNYTLQLTVRGVNGRSATSGRRLERVESGR